MALDMSSEELRAHLFRSLQGRGVLDSLKSQLRNRLATELQRSLGPTSSVSPTPTPVMGSMTLQVANSIVAEHLRKARYEYSLSVFLPEAGVDSGKMFSAEELLQFMKIAPLSPLHDSLLEGEKEHGLLVALVAGLAVHGSPPRVESAAVQTEGEGTSGTKPSVMARLQALDESYAGRVEEEGRRHQQSLEERMAAFQREAEARYRGQLETEMAHFRERELARVRQEERERGREELSRERVELHHTHQQKLEAVRRMEQESLLRLRRKEQELEAGLYSQRQALLAELDALRARESELKRQAEVERRAASVGEEHMRNMAEQLAEKEKAMELVREQCQQEAEEKVQRRQVESEVGLQSKRAELSSWEAELGARQRELEALREECHHVGGEVKGERAKVEELQRQLHAATSQQVILQQHKEQLQQRLSQMSDYPHLKRRVSEVGKQLQASEQRLADVRAEHHQQSTEQLQLIKQLQRRLARPSADHLALQAELEEARRTHQQETLAAGYKDQQLRRQLASQSELCAGLQRQVEEQTVQLRAALREVEDLHYQLKHRATPTPGKRLPSQPKKVTPAAPRPIRHHHHPPPATHSCSPYSRDLGPDLAAVTDAPGQLLEETRAVFARLEQEAQELEQSYQFFQQRMVGGFVNSFPQEPASLPTTYLPYSSLPSSSLPHPSLLDPGLASGGIGHKAHSATKPAISLTSQPTTSQMAPNSMPEVFHLTPSSRSLSATLSTTSLPFTSQHTQISTATPATPSHTSHAKPPSTSTSQPLATAPQPTISLHATALSPTVRQTYTTAAMSAPVMSTKAAPSVAAPTKHTPTSTTSAQQPPASTDSPLSSVGWTTAPTETKHSLLPETTHNISLGGGSVVAATVTRSLVTISEIVPPTFSSLSSTIGSLSSTHSGPLPSSTTPPTSVIPLPVTTTPPTSVIPLPVTITPPTSVIPLPVTTTPPTSVIPLPVTTTPPTSVIPVPVTITPPHSTGATPTSVIPVPVTITRPHLTGAPPTSVIPVPVTITLPHLTGAPPTSVVSLLVTTTPPMEHSLPQSADMAPGHQMTQSKGTVEGFQPQDTSSMADMDTAIVTQQHSSGKPAANLMMQQRPAPVAVSRSIAVTTPSPRLSLDDLWKVSSASGGTTVERIREEQLDQESPPSHPTAVSMGTVSPPSRPNVEPTLVTAGTGLGQDREEVDPVMMKYLKLVEQRREQQKAQDVSNIGEAWSAVPEGEGLVDRQPGAAEDYGLPSLSQPSDQDRFSDDGNPFDDW